MRVQLQSVRAFEPSDVIQAFYVAISTINGSLNLRKNPFEYQSILGGMIVSKINSQKLRWVSLTNVHVALGGIHL